LVGGLRPLAFPVARRAPLVRPSMSARWLEGSRDAREPREPSLDPPCQDRVLACPVRSGRAHRSGTPSVVPLSPWDNAHGSTRAAQRSKRAPRRGFAHPFARHPSLPRVDVAAVRVELDPAGARAPKDVCVSGPEMRLGRRLAIHEFSMTEHPLTMRLPACLEGRRWTSDFTALARFGPVVRVAPRTFSFRERPRVRASRAPVAERSVARSVSRWRAPSSRPRPLLSAVDVNRSTAIRGPEHSLFGEHPPRVFVGLRDLSIADPVLDALSLGWFPTAI
jgi:hypothetical protein